MAKKHKYGEVTKVIGIRVPTSKFEEMKKPIREFVDYYIKGGKCITEILKENKELQEFKDAVVKQWKANELTPEDFHDILMADNDDNDCS